MATSQLDRVSVLTQANVYFDGRCVSHTVLLEDGTRKSVGVILPGTLRFDTGAPEVMELIDGRCKVQRAGDPSPVEFAGGQSFAVEGNSSFEIEVTQTLHYVCHFG